MPAGLPGRAAAVTLLSLATLTVGPPAFGEQGRADGNPGRAQAYHLYSLAQQSLLRRDYATAIDLLESAAARDASPDLLVELSHLHFALNNTARAESLALRAAAAAPDLAAAHRLLGDIYLGRAREGIEVELNLERAVESYGAAHRADPEDAEVARVLADLLYRSGRLEAAGDVLRPLFTQNPLDPAIATLMGRILLRAGRLDAAQQALERIVALPSADVEAADTLGSIYEFQQDYESALEVYHALVEQHPDDAYLRYRTGYLELLAGRYQQALRELEESHRLEPGNDRCLMPMAQAHEGAGNIAEALATYTRLIDRDPENLEARFQRSRLQVSEGFRQAALDGFGEIITLAAGLPVINDRQRSILALSHMQTGLIELGMRRYEEAAAALQQAIEVSKDPGPELFLLLGRARLQANDPPGTERVIAEAARLFPEDLDIKILQGEALIARGERARAHEIYRQLLDEQSRSAQGYLLVSEALLRQEWFEEADLLLEEGISRYPADDRLFFARGAATERLGRIDDAERLLSKAIGLNPDNAMALNYLGYMLADHGLKLQDSVVYVQRAVELDPKNPAYLDSLGWVQFKMARYDSAEEHLRAALRYDDSDPTIREHMGDLLMATGRAEEALREWQAALGHGHENPDRLRRKVAEARSRLRRSE